MQTKHVGIRLGEFIVHHVDPLFDFCRAGWLLRLFEQSRHERIVRDADDGNDLSHAYLRRFVELVSITASLIF